MPIEIHGNGGFTAVGSEAVNLVRLITLQSGLRFEIKTGMKLHRGRTCYAIIKSEFGFKGNKANVLEQFEAYVATINKSVVRVDKREVQ